MLSQRLFDGDNHVLRDTVTIKDAQADFALRKVQADFNRTEIVHWQRERVFVGLAAVCVASLCEFNAELDA